MRQPKQLVARPTGRLFGGSAFILVLVLGAPGRAHGELGGPPLRRQMVYDPGQPIPTGYHVEHRTRYGLIITGSLLFAVSYGPSLGMAFLDGDDGSALFAIPILGPLLAMPGQIKNNCVEMDHSPYWDFGRFASTRARAGSPGTTPPGCRVQDV